jgi:hypothetical protein
MDLRIGEVWEDMAEELEYEYVRPISPDLEIIRSAIQQTQCLATTLQKSQRALVEQTAQVFFLCVCTYGVYLQRFGQHELGDSLTRFS